jgi:hypothetical protein
MTDEKKDDNKIPKVMLVRMFLPMNTFLFILLEIEESNFHLDHGTILLFMASCYISFYFVTCKDV